MTDNICNLLIISGTIVGIITMDFWLTIYSIVMVVIFNRDAI